jgi:hypothetical protein
MPVIKSDDQGRLATDAVAVMTENNCPDGPRSEPDEKYAERLQRTDQWVCTGKVKLAEHQSSHDAIQ